MDGLESLHSAYAPSPHQKVSKNRNLELRESVIVGEMAVNTTNSVYKLQRQLFARSERVKGIDFHPVEPWILTTLYSGMFDEAQGGGLWLISPRACLHMVV